MKFSNRASCIPYSNQLDLEKLFLYYPTQYSRSLPVTERESTRKRCLHVFVEGLKRHAASDEPLSVVKPNVFVTTTLRVVLLDGNLKVSTMIDDLFSMHGQICVVTGGSTGLGSYMARGFLGAGAARVYITARSPDRLQATASELSKVAAGECIALPGDLLSGATIEALARDLQDREEHINVLVNNAGMASMDLLGEATEDQWNSTVALNLRTPFFLTQALHGLLSHKATAENPSRVINTSSAAASGSFPYVFSYGASKAALEQLTRSLAKRLADEHILVNAIAPGLFVSEMTARHAQNLGPEAVKRQIEKLPLRRYGEMPDIAGVAIMLCSRAGAYLTGEVLNVDGGYRLVY